MRILQVHKYYWHRDGASNYFLYLIDLLRQAGHEAIPFAMRQQEMIPNQFQQFFVSEMDLAHPDNMSLIKKIQYALRMFYSFEAKQKLDKLISFVEMDVAHLHNIYHHISPSILPVLKSRHVPIVMTVHDYHLVSPNYTLFHHGANHEEDARGWYTSCVKNKCVKNSRSQSIISTMEMIWHHKIMRSYERYVDKYIAPSQWMMTLCVRHGFPKEKFVHIPHPIDVDTFVVQEKDEGYVAYVGRLSQEKGVDILLRAAQCTPHIPYQIVGEGPERESLQTQAETLKLKNVTFTGFQTGDRLRALIANARLLIVPSMWYENYPLSILEPKAMGKVVLGSALGGIPELLPKELLFPPGDAITLATRIDEWYTASFSKRQKMGNKLRKEVETVNDPIKHRQRLLRLYSSLI